VLLFFKLLYEVALDLLCSGLLEGSFSELELVDLLE
jgi:hypothetical protein